MLYCEPESWCACGFCYVSCDYLIINKLKVCSLSILPPNQIPTNVIVISYSSFYGSDVPADVLIVVISFTSHGLVLRRSETT